jgi:hypothetical protein
LISGVVAGPNESESSTNLAKDKNEAKTIWCRNDVVVTFPSPLTDVGYIEFVQHKHHRWRLDKDQITRYGLSSSLGTQHTWWEGIEVHDRSINFLKLRTWLSTCVLICEDLARIDPVGSRFSWMDPNFGKDGLHTTLPFSLMILALLC